MKIKDILPLPLNSNTTPVTESDLEKQLAAMSSALLASYHALHERRNAIGRELRAIQEAPPAREDLGQFLIGFLDAVMDTEPHGLRLKLRANLERLWPNPAHVAEMTEGWLQSVRSGLDNFEWLWMPLLSESLKAGARQLAESLPWENPGLPAAERAEKVRGLTETMEGLSAEIEDLRARAARFNITLA